jgi:putative endonuclease
MEGSLPLVHRLSSRLSAAHGGIPSPCAPFVIPTKRSAWRDPFPLCYAYTVFHRLHYYIYIMASTSGTLYIGVTNNILRRVCEHQEELMEGFTKKYHCKKLVYLESFFDITTAIAREKQLKNWNRNKKINLIKKINPTWKDLSSSLINMVKY